MKKTKTLSFKLSFLFISGMSFAMLAGSITTYVVQDKIVHNFTDSRLRNTVYEFSEQINADLLRAETIVKTSSYLVNHYFNSKDQLQDSTYITTSLDAISESGGLHELSASEYEDVCAHYVFLNPEIVGVSSTSKFADGCGFFHVKNSDGVFEPRDVNNPLYYENKTDRLERAGWWFAAKEARQPVWMEPYYNLNIDRNMFSYVHPIFEDKDSSKELLGIVGIDIDLNSVIKDIGDMGDYKDAYAYLSTKDGKIVYHPDVETIINGRYYASDKTLETISGVKDLQQSESGVTTYKYKGRKRSSMTISLINELVYGVSVRTSELRKPIRLVAFLPQITYLLVLILSLFLFYFIINRHLKPLQDLHDAVEKVKEGDFKFDIKAKGNDEIADLTNSFLEMVTALDEKNRMITAIAYQDGLTGVKNSNAYRDFEKRINNEIKEGKAKFAVILLDVDKLKMINDNLGHEAGDKVIIGCCYTLCKGFSHSPVFRVGGDEFVAIALGEDYEKRLEIFEKLRDHKILVKNTKYDYSIGLATYEAGFDHSFKDVFARADQEMYLNKKAKRKYE